ncbi:hypothetical protein DRQ25_00855 [Candidatus Fermentibacteria bacterium]|nr:MAG: hypothetical protein DRQ25_00855 [Candidatus Fermentibacteria bacterium]
MRSSDPSSGGNIHHVPTLALAFVAGVVPKDERDDPLLIFALTALAVDGRTHPDLLDCQNEPLW